MLSIGCAKTLPVAGDIPPANPDHPRRWTGICHLAAYVAVTNQHFTSDKAHQSTINRFRWARFLSAGIKSTELFLFLSLPTYFICRLNKHTTIFLNRSPRFLSNSPGILLYFYVHYWIGCLKLGILAETGEISIYR